MVAAPATNTLRRHACGLGVFVVVNSAAPIFAQLIGRLELTMSVQNTFSSWMMTRILDLLRDYLQSNGYRVSDRGGWQSHVVAQLERQRVDLVVLDVMLPGDDGLVLCRQLRASSGLPVIMLTALGEDTERIIGLEMGADDYLESPSNPRELLARIRGVLQRAGGVPVAAARYDSPIGRSIGNARHLISKRCHRQSEHRPDIGCWRPSSNTPNRGAQS